MIWKVFQKQIGGNYHFSYHIYLQFGNQYLLNNRMLTDSNMGAIGAAFTKAPKDSVFGKVFNNNMDRNSFSSDTKNQIALMISNSKTAMFYSHSAVVFEQEYANCQVNMNSKFKSSFKNIIA